MRHLGNKIGGPGPTLQHISVSTSLLAIRNKIKIEMQKKQRVCVWLAQAPTGRQHPISTAEIKSRW